MDNSTKLKNKMNEILRGNTDMLARKYIGRSADGWSRKQKDKALADVYAELQKEVDKAEPVKSDIDLRKEQIDNEMKNIRNRDRDELLSKRIKNYDPSMNVKDKDRVLAEVYDVLQKERSRLDRVHSMEEYEEVKKRLKELSMEKRLQAELTEPKIKFLPDRIGKPEVKYLPLAPENPEIKLLPGTVENPEIMPLPYRPGTDNGFTKFPRIIDGEVTGEKTTGEDILRGNESSGNRLKMLSNRSDIQPVKYSMTSQNEDFSPRDENTIWNTIDKLTYGDMDSVLAQEAERWGLPYSPDMNDLQKEKLGTIVYQYLYYELNVAKGADVTSPEQDKDILQKLYEIEYNEGKDARPISLAASAIGNVLFPQNDEEAVWRIPTGAGNQKCINGQGIEDNGIRDLKVGTKGTVAENGCGIIAIYNALTLNGIDVEFKDVLNEANNMDGLLLRGGKWGTNPNKIGDVLENHGLNYAKYNNPKDFNDAIKHGGTYIVSFWNDRNPWEGAHIVAFTSDKDGDIIVYNVDNEIESAFEYSSRGDKTGLDRYMQGKGNSMTLYKVG